MEEKPDALDIITSCQRSLAPLRKYEDNIVHHLNRINTKSSSDCSTFRNHLEDLWQSRKLILDEAFLRMEDREKKLEESEIEQKDLHFIYKTKNWLASQYSVEGIIKERSISIWKDRCLDSVQKISR